MVVGSLWFIIKLKFQCEEKNLNEINLLKAEDERYEFDLYLKRLSKAK